MLCPLQTDQQIFQRLEDPLEVGFLKEGLIYTTQRIGIVDEITKTAFARLQLYVVSFGRRDGDGKASCFELNDRSLIVSPANFIRWRLTSSNYFWGTECSLDDHETGIFRIPLRILKSLDPVNVSTGKRLKDRPGFYGLNNFSGGNRVIRDIVFKYSLKRRGLNIPEGIILPGHPEWVRDFKGIYFDFTPSKDKDWISLFILFDKNNLEFSKTHQKHPATNVIEVLESEKACVDNSIKDGTFDGNEILRSLVAPFRQPRELVIGWIATDMSEPFYVFARKDDYYFTTISGKVYVAPHVALDPKKMEQLIAELDSDTYGIREKATRNLRNLGKPAQPFLEAHLSHSISQEQKRRIIQILDAIQGLPDRETRLLWKDENRPVDKILFDLDKDKVYAFTKPNRDKQMYFFEIATKPQPHLFTGKPDLDGPTTVPASARTFLEYARFVRKLGKKNSVD